MRSIGRASRTLLVGLLLLAWMCPAAIAGPANVSASLAELLDRLPARATQTGILYDRVMPLSSPERYDGRADAPPISLAGWRQLVSELDRAAFPGDPRWAGLPALAARAAHDGRSGVVPLALLNVLYERIRHDALESGALLVEPDPAALGGPRLVLSEAAERGLVEPFEVARAIAVTPLTGRTYQGGRVEFRLDESDYLTNDPAGVRAVEVDFDDGLGSRPVVWGSALEVRYAETGLKTIRIRLAMTGGSVLHAAGLFDVRRLQTPLPDDTLGITAAISYGGVAGTGEAYVYLAPGHAAITNPVVVIEGFDYDNTMNWNELYELLNREQLLERLRALGFDAVVLNFTDAVDYIQRNAFVAVELIAEVRDAIAPGQTMAVVGASMGGLIGRYALAYMETQGMPAPVRTFLSFDAPQAGADIPLGIQYWLDFFAGDSPDAAALLAALDTPGARQMLAYHHTDPPGTTGEADPLRAELTADLLAAGDFPASPRKAAVANGSGFMLDQGFAAGAQIIRWEYSSLLLRMTGNVWAVPDATSQRIFQGEVWIFLVRDDRLDVTVSDTRPFDNAPGGWRNSMEEMDAVPAPYGDILALHPNHCFIPTVSALGLATNDLFHDVAGDPDLLALTPFDAVYFPSTNENQEHVAITAESAEWFLAEISRGATAIADEEPGRPHGWEANEGIARIAPASANPAGESVRIRFSIPRAGRARVALYDASGRCVAVLADRLFEAGDGEIVFERSRAQGGVPAGVYFVHLRGMDGRGAGYAASAKLSLR